MTIVSAAKYEKGLSAYLQLMAATIDQALMIQLHEQLVPKG